jgi:hypothetical protein
MKRSQMISLVLISSATLVSCAEEQAQTSRTFYQTRAECEREWGAGDDRCRQQGGYYASPYYLFMGGRGYFYPYTSGGQPAQQPLQAPLGARFDPNGHFVSSAPGTVSSRSGVMRGGFGGRGFGGFGLGG